MSPKKPKNDDSIEGWLASLKTATQEVASTALRFDKAVAGEPLGKVVRPGAYIAILGDDVALHLGISASPAGLGVLARSLLGLRGATELTEREMVDAVSELMNIVAGKVKSKFFGDDPSLRLGLPLFVQGQIQVTDHMEKAVSEVKIGPVTCELMVFRNQRGMRKAA